jgi:acetyl-CoA acyltransferase
VSPTRSSTGCATPAYRPSRISQIRSASPAGSATTHLGGRYGLQTMCEAGGTANASLIERL